MKSLNKKATAIFLTLTKDLEDPTKSDNSHRKINSSETFLPVHVERIGKDEYSIAHYIELNGDLMRDPEMVFYVKGKLVYPTYWRNDYTGIEQFSARQHNGKWEVQTRLQAYHAEFAETWLNTIKEQQGL